MSRLYVKRFQTSDADVDALDEASCMLEPRIKVGYELTQLKSQWTRDAAWTDATDWTFVHVYGVRAISAAAVDETVARHEQGFRSRAATGVETQPKHFEITQEFDRLLVPSLYVLRNGAGAAVSVRDNWDVHFRLVSLSMTGYLDLLSSWSVDAENDLSLPVRYRV